MILVSGGVKEQTHQVMMNLEEVLKAAGGSLKVKYDFKENLNIY